MVIHHVAYLNQLHGTRKKMRYFREKEQILLKREYTKCQLAKWTWMAPSLVFLTNFFFKYEYYFRLVMFVNLKSTSNVINVGIKALHRWRIYHYILIVVQTIVDRSWHVLFLGIIYMLSNIIDRSLLCTLFIIFLISPEMKSQRQTLIYSN